MMSTQHPPQDLEFMLVLFAAGYSLGAHASLRRAAAGLAISAVIIPASEGALPTRGGGWTRSSAR